MFVLSYLSKSIVNIDQSFIITLSGFTYLYIYVYKLLIFLIVHNINIYLVSVPEIDSGDRESFIIDKYNSGGTELC